MQIVRSTSPAMASDQALVRTQPAIRCPKSASSSSKPEFMALPEDAKASVSWSLKGTGTFTAYFLAFYVLGTGALVAVSLFVIGLKMILNIWIWRVTIGGIIMALIVIIRRLEQKRRLRERERMQVNNAKWWGNTNTYEVSKWTA